MINTKVLDIYVFEVNKNINLQVCVVETTQSNSEAMRFDVVIIKKRKGGNDNLGEIVSQEVWQNYIDAKNSFIKKCIEMNKKGYTLQEPQKDNSVILH